MKHPGRPHLDAVLEDTNKAVLDMKAGVVEQASALRGGGGTGFLPRNWTPSERPPEIG